MPSSFSEARMFPGERMPLVLQPAASNANLIELADRNKDVLASMLIEHGAILFRGFNVQSVEYFDRVIEVLSECRIDYVYRSTPRTALGNAIYTATEYPPDREIDLHNENAYQTRWPLKIAFACLTPAASGGETPIADMRRVSAGIGTRLLDVFESRRVRYRRHYHPNFDLPWQEVFQTDDRARVAAFCEASGISHDWISVSTLRTTQTCQGTAVHPVTNERTFFNQAHLFHVSGLGAELADLMMEVFGPDQLPRHATYGDGSEIDRADLEVIRDAYRSAALTFTWETGDVLLLDNMQVAHGRRPFSGERTVVAALFDPYSAS